MFKKIAALSILLTLFFLSVFVGRQVVLSTGLVQTQTDLAGDLISDFLSSPGAVWDLLRFLFFALLLHGMFALLVALASYAILPGSSDARRIRSTTALIFFVFALTVLLWVSLYFPLTLAGFLKFSPLSTIELAYGLSLILALMVIVGTVRLFFNQKYIVFSAAMSTLVMIFLAVGDYQFSSIAFADNGSRNQATSKPNVIVIGIDALRPDHLGFNGYPYNLTPNVDDFLAESLYFEQAFTPIARTYTAWFSLLSGKSPKTTGIRYNLQKFDEGQLTGGELQTVLRNQGYHTIYGMDERRFNNIDERYGFHQDVGPEIGAADFLLFHASELPLVALVSNTPIGEWFFPLIYANRGIHGTYMPETFTSEVMEAVSDAPDKPLFLAMHLTLPHWPYLYREFNPLEQIPFDPDNKFHYTYQLMLNEVDTQFRNIMDGLERRGVLDNSLVFLVSDHGEGFMLERDSLTAGNAEIEFPTEAHGHGTNVLDEKQYHVVLAVQDRTGSEVHAPRRVDTLVSLLDIAPTVTKAVGLKADRYGYEGESLFVLGDCVDCSNRRVFVESSVATNAMFEEDLDMMQVMAEGIGYYTVDSDGLAIIRDEVGQMLGMKQRAVIDKDHIVAHFPGLEKDFLIVDREQGIWWPSSQYGGDKPQKVLSLMRDLCSYFDGDSGFDTNGLCRGAVN